MHLCGVDHSALQIWAGKAKLIRVVGGFTWRQFRERLDLRHHLLLNLCHKVVFVGLGNSSFLLHFCLNLLVIETLMALDTFFFDR